MEWLKDKKNLPIVAGLGVVVLILAIVAILFETGVIGGSGQAGADATASAPSPPPPAPSSPPPPTDASAAAPGPPSGPSGPGRPGAPGAPGAPAAKTAVKVPVNVAKGPDPFTVPKVPGQPSNPGTPPKPTKPPINSFVQPLSIAREPSSNGFGAGGGNTAGGNNSTTPPLPVPNIRLTTEESQTMRVSGVVLTNGSGIRAVLEANGQSLTVQPGDAVPGGTVISIQADGLTMRADDGRLIHVPISNGMAGNPQGG